MLVCLCLSPALLQPSFFFFFFHQQITGLWRGVWAKMSQGLRGFCLLRPAGSAPPALCAASSPKQVRSGISSSFAVPYWISPSGEIAFLHVYRWVKRETWDMGQGEEEEWVEKRSGDERREMDRGERGWYLQEREDMGTFVFYILVEWAFSSVIAWYSGPYFMSGSNKNTHLQPKYLASVFENSWIQSLTPQLWWFLTFSLHPASRNRRTKDGHVHRLQLFPPNTPRQVLKTRRLRRCWSSDGLLNIT